MHSRERVPRARALLAAALALILPVCACSRATPTPEALTIRFACPDEDLGYYDQLAHAFSEAQPGVTVELLPKRPVALRALNPAECDVFIASQSSALLADGAVLDLETWLAEHASSARADFFPCALAPYTRNGKTWALPIGVDPALMFYNKSLFDERGVPYPAAGWTWEDFLQTARKLRAGRGGVYGYAAGAWPDEPLLFVLQHGGRIVDDWQNPTRATLDDPATVEALQWYAELMYLHDVSPNPDEARALFGGGRQAAYNGVMAGKVAMWVGPYSSRTALDAREPRLDWGVVPLPSDLQAATLVQVEAVAVSAQAGHPAACWQWAAFLSRQAPRRLAPARRAVAESEAYAQQVGPDVAAAAREALEYAVVVPQEPAEFYGKVNEAWAKAVSNVTSGRYGAVEALRQAQAQASR